MNEIDLRPGQNDYRVHTQVDGSNAFDKRMGPEVIVSARDEKHAEELVTKAGHQLNPHFPTKRIRK